MRGVSKPYSKHRKFKFLHKKKSIHARFQLLNTRKQFAKEGNATDYFSRARRLDELLEAIQDYFLWDFQLA